MKSAKKYPPVEIEGIAGPLKVALGHGVVLGTRKRQFILIASSVEELHEIAARFTTVALDPATIYPVAVAHQNCIVTRDTPATPQVIEEDEEL